MKRRKRNGIRFMRDQEKRVAVDGDGDATYGGLPCTSLYILQELTSLLIFGP